MAASRLLKGFRSAGINAEMLVHEKIGDFPFVKSKSRNRYGNVTAKLRPLLDLQPLYWFYRQRKRVPYSLHWVPERNVNRINRMQPDIINLHWISAGFMRIESISKLNSQIVWTLHDMWPFTGGCHFSKDCNRYSNKCGKCPLLESSFPMDLSRIIWLRKDWAWKKMNMSIVSPSRWLAEKAAKSSLFSRLPIEIIPNGLDTKRFRPMDKSTARDLLGLPVKGKIILFGGIKPFDDPRKGFQYLPPTLKQLKSYVREDINLAVFGTSYQKNDMDLDVKIFYLGYLTDDTTLALMYSAADVYITPSLVDNLPNTVMEALSCGTPCVAFNIGGMGDMILHKENGYLARPFDTNDLAYGLFWIISNQRRLAGLSDRARSESIRKFDFLKQAERYNDLFEKMGRKANAK